MMRHVFQVPLGFTPDMGLPAFMVCVCGKRWNSDRPKPTSECSGKRGGHTVKKLNSKQHKAITPATHELSRTQLGELSVMSVKRASGDRDAFALGNQDRDTWYAEHAYRAITHWGALRFPTADDAWAKLTELTGRVRPKKPLKQWTVVAPELDTIQQEVWDTVTSNRSRGELYDTSQGVAMSTKEQ